MGLIGEVLLLPFAPVRGSGWVMRQLIREAERLYYDPTAVRAELARLEEQLDAGEIDEEEFDRREDELLDRLEIGLRTAAGPGEGTAR
ncbi:gas vesicle protein GvpG [Streptomyces sp. TRM68367]|uniref:gas vesicle protein GvpG n=1 Tax=Streptomyces sp. TRM68367 TaxID=2758415 RepID=UPI00165C86C2|nr:gas vesicle protein GvpG [Streptomyces sp. TRM68367]MBC9728686.1 gas vesicle protein GvpG [Streptomyces sp. TRM68367]